MKASNSHPVGVQLSLAGGMLERLPKPVCQEVNPFEIPLSTHTLAPDNSFCELVRQFGVVVPVVIATAQGGVVLVQGRRRVMAARIAGSLRIPARLYRFETVGADVLPMIAAELGTMLQTSQRSNPLADLEAVQELMRRGCCAQQITAVTGLPAARIRQIVALGSLHPALQGGLQQGRVSLGVARTCVKLPPSLQAELATRIGRNGRLTAGDISEVRRGPVTAALDALFGAVCVQASQPAKEISGGQGYEEELIAALPRNLVSMLRETVPATPRFDALRAACDWRLSATSGRS